MLTPPQPRRPRRDLAAELEDLRARLTEAEETLDAIRSGSVDALVVRGAEGEQVYTLTSADRAFRELAERMTDGAATIDGDGTILWANRQLAALLQRPLGRLVGSTISVFAAGDDGENVALLLERGRDSEQAREFDLCRPDRSTVPVRLSVTPVSVGGFPARAVIFADLTEQRRSEAVLRQSAAELEQRVSERTAELLASRRDLEAAEDRTRRLLEAVAAQLPIGIVVAEPGGRIVYHNDEARRIWRGLPLDEELYPPAPQKRKRAREVLAPQESALRRALAGEHVLDAEVAVDTGDGPAMTALVRADPIHDEAGQVAAAVCAIIDITERRRSEALRDAFIDVTAHELKTPLTTIYGGVQTLLARDARLDDETRRGLLVDAVAESERLVHLVDDMLVLSRVERGVDFIVGEPMVLEHVAREVIEREDRRGGTASRATLRLASESIPVVSGEQMYVEQILDNFLRNAAKYGRPPIEVVVERAEDGVAVRVLDGGPGFTSEPGALFDLFYREPSAKTRASGGGIGLFVCRELARMMGGRVWARNRPEGGAEFGFVLPRYAESDE